VLGKLRRRVHKAANLNTANDAIKIAATSFPEVRERVQSAHPCGPATIFRRQLGTKLAFDELAIERWQLAGQINERARV
jgi:hypothetical protein